MKKYIYFVPLLIGLLLATSCEEKDLAHVVVCTYTDVEAQFDHATVNGSVDIYGNASVEQVGFCCAQHSMPTETDMLGVCSKDDMVVTFNDLRYDTRYYVRAFVKNTYGIAYGNEVEFVTKKLPLPIVETLQPRGITEYGAIVGGTVTSEVAQVTERGVCYTTSSTIAPTMKDQHIVAGVAGDGKYECALTNLSTQNKYYVRAYAINVYGVAYGEVVQFTTK